MPFTSTLITTYLGLQSVGTITAHIPWVGRPLAVIPYFSSRMYKLRAFGTNIATTRVESGSSEKDLWYHLVNIGTSFYFFRLMVHY